MSRTVMRAFGSSSRTGHNSDGFYRRTMYKNFIQRDNNFDAETPIQKNSLNKVYRHSSEEMSELPSNSIHLMVTSPPYNVGKEYDNDLTEKQYRKLLNSVWMETHRVLVPGGRACVNIANIGRKPYIPLHAWIIDAMHRIGFLMRGEIIWDKGASAGASTAWGSWMSPSNPVLRDVHEYILVFCKGAYSRKSNGKGATIAKEQFLEWTKSVWSFPAASAKKEGHPAPFPQELPYRLIQLYTYRQDVVLDPFMGGGSSALAADRSDRNWVGYELSDNYADICESKLKGALKI